MPSNVILCTLCGDFYEDDTSAFLLRLSMFWQVLRQEQNSRQRKYSMCTYIHMYIVQQCNPQKILRMAHLIIIKEVEKQPQTENRCQCTVGINCKSPGIIYSNIGVHTNYIKTAGTSRQIAKHLKRQNYSFRNIILSTGGQSQCPVYYTLHCEFPYPSSNNLVPKE